MNHKDKQIRCKKCRKGSYQRTNDYLEMGAVRSFFSLIHYRCTHCRTKRIILQPLQKILLVGFAFLLLVTVIFISQSYLAFRKYRSSHQIQFSTINTPKQTTSVPIKETANRTEKKLKAFKPRQDNLPSPAKPASAPTVETKPEEKPGTETEKNPGTETDQIKKNISTEPPPPAVDKQIDQAGKPPQPPAGQQPEKQKQTTHHMYLKHGLGTTTRTIMRLIVFVGFCVHYVFIIFQILLVCTNGLQIPFCISFCSFLTTFPEI